MPLPTFAERLREIVSLNSISSEEPELDQSNESVIRCLERWLRELGFDVTLIKVKEKPLKYDLLARLGEGDGGLLLSGHTDTVPADPASWKSDPLSLTETEDRYTGLGSIDMKGFFAFAADAAASFSGKKLREPLYILATSDEETTMNGAKAFMEQASIRPRAVIIGEPTSLTPVYKHKGYMAFRVIAHGRRAHSSNPAEGINAIEIMHRAIAGIMKFRDNLKKFRSSDFKVPEPTLNIGIIRGGDSPNSVPDTCVMQFDVRPTELTPVDFIEKEVRKAIAQSAGEYSGSIEIEDLYPPLPAFGGGLEQPVVKKLAELSGNEPVTVGYATEAGLLSALTQNTVVFGAGSISNAHQPDEYLLKKEIEPMSRILREIICLICEKGELQ
ncbi:MAG: acetylornithine deacetylase [Succinivibrionaceae bacterium]|nr:acetylornithine deacetylase [Succinivibrionaceae bacterium]